MIPCPSEPVNQTCLVLEALCVTPDVGTQFRRVNMIAV
jgi:hypothetical protein